MSKKEKYRNVVVFYSAINSFHLQRADIYERVCMLALAYARSFWKLMIEHHFIILIILKESILKLFPPRSFSSFFFPPVVTKRIFYQRIIATTTTTPVTSRRNYHGRFPKHVKTNKWKKNVHCSNVRALLASKPIELCDCTDLNQVRDGEKNNNRNIVHDAHRTKMLRKRKMNGSWYASNTTSQENYRAVIWSSRVISSYIHAYVYAYYNFALTRKESKTKQNAAREKTDQTKHETALSVQVVMVSLFHLCMFETSDWFRLKRCSTLTALLLLFSRCYCPSARVEVSRGQQIVCVNIWITVNAIRTSIASTLKLKKRNLSLNYGNW